MYISDLTKLMSHIGFTGTATLAKWHVVLTIFGSTKAVITKVEIYFFIWFQIFFLLASPLKK